MPVKDAAPAGEDAPPGSTTAPRVTIGVPVYNGAAYLEGALASLVGQTFTDLEVIISDNGSTDETPAICQAAAERDPRIRFVRSEVNRGLIWNHLRVLDLARGEYFMYAPHDDWFAPEYVASCVAVLDADPDVSYVYAETRLADENGAEVGRELARQRFDNPSPRIRFWDFLVVQGGVNWYGLARRSLWNRVGRYKALPRSERIVLAELALHGPFRLLTDDLYFRRAHEGQATATRRSRRAETRVLDPERRGWRAWEPVLIGEYMLEFGRAVLRAPLSPAERRATLRVYARWILSHVPGFHLADPRTRDVAIVRTGSAVLPEGRGGIGY